MGAARIEVEGPLDTDGPILNRLGCVTEIVSWRTRVFVPVVGALERLLDRYPLGPEPALPRRSIRMAARRPGRIKCPLEKRSKRTQTS